MDYGLRRDVAGRMFYGSAEGLDRGGKDGVVVACWLHAMKISLRVAVHRLSNSFLLSMGWNGFGPIGAMAANPCCLETWVLTGRRLEFMDISQNARRSYIELNGFHCTSASDSYAGYSTYRVSSALPFVANGYDIAGMGQKNFIC